MQPDEHGLKIELIEAGSDTDWLELEMETPQTVNNFLDMQRESGDGDSGAECKEPPEDAKDFLEIKDALSNITREVQGAERTKDHKKLSRIPVRQNRAPYGHGQLRPATDKNTSSGDKNQTEKQTIESCNMKMDEKWREIKHLVEEEEYLLLEKAYAEEEIRESIEKENLNVGAIAFELRDIYQDLATIPMALNQESADSSLSPRAPLANPEETTSDDLTIDEVDETILEAPEEFRSDVICELEMSVVDVSDSVDDATWCPSGEEIELSNAHRVEHSRASCAGAPGEEPSRDRGEPAPEVEHNASDRDASTLGTGRGNEIPTDMSTGRMNVVKENTVTISAVAEESTDNGETITAVVVEEPVSAGGSSDSGSRLSAMRLSDGLALPLAVVTAEIAEAATTSETKHVGELDAGIRDAMNEAVSSVAWPGQSDAGWQRVAARACDAQRTLAAAAAVAVQASIASGDAARCSRVSAVTVRATPRITTHTTPDTGDEDAVDGSACTRARGLDWEFRDGRLVFISNSDASDSTSSRLLHSADKTVPTQSDSDARHPSLFDVLDTCTQRIEHEIAKSNGNANADVDETENASEPLRSRDINRRSVDTGSRLKLLETKLKEAAGLNDNNYKPNSEPSIAKDKLYKPLVVPKWNKLCEELTDGSGDVQRDYLDSEKEQVVDKSVLNPAGILLDKNDNECCEVDRDRRRLHADVRDSDGDCDYPQIEITELGSPADLDAFLDDRFGGRCEFDVKRIGSFSGFGADSEFYLVYDELEDGYSSSGDEGACATVVNASQPEPESEQEPEQVSESSGSMRGDGGGGGGEGEARKRHNPDHDNLKSLLKKPGRGKDKKNRVSFNENRNEFFDADYIILIREDCDYDEDDDDGVCTCNQHEMVRLTCCEPGCSCGYDEAGAAPSSGPTPQSPKFAPPLEFVDSVTLSPPEGYKDMDLGEQQLIALQQMARHRQQHPPVCKECSGVHDSDSNSGSEQEEPQYIEKPHQERISSDEYLQSQNTGDQTLEEKEKTDQSQQTTPTTPPADCTSVQSRYIMETITMTTVTERRMVREVEDGSPVEAAPSPSPSLQNGEGGSPISGILKGGKLWKAQQLAERPGEPPVLKGSDNMQVSDSSNITSDEEGNTLSRRSVRFHESDSEQRDSCDGEADKGITPEEVVKKVDLPEVITHEEDDNNQNQKETDSCNNSVSPDATEMMLTFKLGHHVLISNNSLRPNSAVRQLFPCSKPMVGKTEEDGSVHQYLVTAESLKAFEEAKRSKLPHIMDGDDTIRRTIERNTLRRSLIRYEPRSKKQQQKTDNSLVERIKLLTCDVDEPPLEEEIPPRGSPPGEESVKPMDTINLLNNRNQDKSFSPSSSSTTSSNSSMSSTYKKITDLFGKREKTAAASDAQNNAINESNTKQNLLQTAPDLGNGGSEFIEPTQALAKINATSEARKQFLSTLAPLTACVSSNAAVDEFQYQYQLANHPGERASVASTAGTEYSLEDIDEALKNDAEDSKKVAPDVLVGTPSASESTDELAMFVQQDASRIERIKKRYQPEHTTEEDDEHDDYGFNRRPSVRGIKPRFGSTTEILQQIQSQLQPPGNPQPTTQQRQQPNHVWPYYSETGLDNPKTRACPQGGYAPQYPYPEELKARTIGGHQYRPTSLIEENIYQNCPNQRCTQLHYGPNVNHVHTPVMRIGGGCSDFYQTLPARTRTRPESPPPMEMSRSYHQTMVLIPYNRIEGFNSGNVSPNPIYSSPEQCNYARFTPSQKFPPQPNMTNKRYPEPVYHSTLPGRISHPPHMDDPQYQLKLGQKQMIRVPYSTGQPVQVHLMASRSESPLPGQFATARATQTPSATLSTCNYYNPGPPNTRYRPAVGPVNAVPHNGTLWHSENPYGNKINRHSFPAGGPRYQMPDNISLADSDSQHSVQLPNGYRQPQMETSFPATRDSSAPASPTKTRFTERGVPEGAASVSPQDSTSTAHNSSTMTSPTSPQNPPAQGANGKSLYYAMNV